MSEASKDIGILTVLADRLVEQRLPRALEIKERVVRGEVLSDSDIGFLEEVFRDAQSIGPIIQKNPQYQDIAARMLGLYKEIMDKALENQESQGSA